MRFFELVEGFFVVILKYTTEGAGFLFGFLGRDSEFEDSVGVIFALQVLPTIIFFAFLTLILYYYGIL